MDKIFQGFECNRRLKTDDVRYNNKIDILLLRSISNNQPMTNDNVFRDEYLPK
jgi:hypothetical protein